MPNAHGPNQMVESIGETKIGWTYKTIWMRSQMERMKCATYTKARAERNYEKCDSLIIHKNN